MIAMKRLVCVHKARGKVTEAIAELTKILETFQNDPECWKELVNLYMSLGDMKQAVYCQEEVVMCDPRNYQVHNRYADLLYSCGGQTNIRSARRQYAQSLELNPRNMRAAYGSVSRALRLEWRPTNKQWEKVEPPPQPAA